MGFEGAAAFENSNRNRNTHTIYYLLHIIIRKAVYQFIYIYNTYLYLLSVISLLSIKLLVLIKILLLKMNSIIVLSFTLFIIINSCVAFSSTHKLSSTLSRSKSLHMSMWGAQKLGQSVIGTTSVESPATQATSWFRRAPIGSGGDERCSNEDNDENENIKYETMSKIDLSFKQHSLMMELNNNKWGTNEKLERIRLGAADGLFPSALSLSSSAHASNLNAGGLMNDWQFDM